MRTYSRRDAEDEGRISGRFGENDCALSPAATVRCESTCDRIARYNELTSAIAPSLRATLRTRTCVARRGSMAELERGQTNPIFVCLLRPRLQLLGDGVLF